MIKILVAHSSAIMRRVIRSIIEKTPFDVDIIELEDISRITESVNDTISLLITNCNISLLEKITNKNLYIILEDDREFVPSELNIISLISKPFRKNLITSIVQSIFDLIENKNSIEKIYFEEKILIVDDKSQFRLLLKEQLKALGITNILEAENGRIAIELISENPDIKVAFIDFKMPIMGGKDLLIQLEKTHFTDDMKIVLMSTLQSEIESAEDLNYPKMVKPFNLIELEKFILTLDESALIDLDSNIDENDDTPVLEKEDKKENTDEIAELINLNINTAPAIDDINEITPSHSVEESIDIYLNKYKNSLKNGKKNISIEKKFEYSKIKRFIFTAYNYLIDLDVSIKSDKILTENFKALVDMEESFKFLSRHKKFSVVLAYEKMFLNQQSNYVFFNKQFQNLDKEIEMVVNRVQMLHSKLEDIKEQIVAHSEEPARVEELSKIFKVINKNYADMLHNMNILKTNSENLDKLLQEFRNKYISKFKDIYMEKLMSVEGELYEVLNICSYNFDYKLWERAKKSVPVKNFFIKSEIDGNYSTQTFLEYYLKTIDASKTNDENLKLFELLNYLKEVDNKNIAIVSSNTNEALIMRDIISSIDKKYKVTALTSIIKLIDLTMPLQDLIIIDLQIKNLDLTKFLKEYKKAYKLKDLSGVKFLLIFEKHDKDLIFNYIECGVIDGSKNFLIKPKNLFEKILIDKISNLT